MSKLYAISKYKRIPRPDSVFQKIDTLTIVQINRLRLILWFKRTCNQVSLNMMPVNKHFEFRRNSRQFYFWIFALVCTYIGASINGSVICANSCYIFYDYMCGTGVFGFLQHLMLAKLTPISLFTKTWWSRYCTYKAAIAHFRWGRNSGWRFSRMTVERKNKQRNYQNSINYFGIHVYVSSISHQNLLQLNCTIFNGRATF